MGHHRSLAIIFSGVIAGAALISASPAMAGYPAYQCYKDAGHNTFCSCKKFKNHATAAKWIGQHVGAAGMHGTPWTSQKKSQSCIN
jgi:hypothetical protein